MRCTNLTLARLRASGTEGYRVTQSERRHVAATLALFVGNLVLASQIKKNARMCMLKCATNIASTTLGLEFACGVPCVSGIMFRSCLNIIAQCKPQS